MKRKLQPDSHANGDGHAEPCSTHKAMLDGKSTWSTVVSAPRRRGDVLDRGARQLMVVTGASAILHTQLVCAIGHAHVDVQLDELMQSRVARRVHAPISSTGESAAMFVEDLAGYIRAQLREAESAGSPRDSSSASSMSADQYRSAAQKQNDGGSAEAGDRKPAGADFTSIQALHLFCWVANRRLTPSLSDTELAADFSSWATAQRPRSTILYELADRTRGESDTATLPIGRCPGPPLPLSSLLPSILSRGLLQRRLDIRGAASSVQGYHFGIPNSGQLMEYIRAGRKELIQRLSRCKYNEMPRKELSAVDLTSSALPTDFHIRDAIGKGLVIELATASGPFIRLVSAGSRPAAR